MYALVSVKMSVTFCQFLKIINAHWYIKESEVKVLRKLIINRNWGCV